MAESTITTTIDPQGYLLITFNGDLTTDTVDTFKKDLADASLIIQKQFEENHRQVKILLDVTHFTGNYATDALAALVAFAQENKPFVEKTASFGGTYKVHLAGEAAIALSGRTNIHMFDDKIDAVMWLLGETVQ